MDPDRKAAYAERSRRTAAILEALDAVEERLDPSPAKRGQRIADVLTLLMLAAGILVLGFPLERPLRLVAVLVLGVGATRLIRYVRQHRLRMERDRLMSQLDKVEGGTAIAAGDAD